MRCRLRMFLICGLAVLSTFTAYAQVQTCPSNIDFSSGDLSNWSAKTGLVGGNSQNYPIPNTGVSAIPEYSITTTGIKVITSSFNDTYGGFSSIPVINGYSYGYSIQIGSNSTSWDLHSFVANPGGFTRSVTYTINVPAGSATVPYTMTYAYAMVLENGTHNSNQQPIFKATLNTPDSTITCASPSYYLPTLDNAEGGSDESPTGATLDTVAALANGFKLSPVFFLSHAGQPGNNGTLLQDVWTKDWTEVTFDLSAYRGQQITLTFESDNCSAGAHFAYVYVALRNDCEGLQISGNAVVCDGSSSTYSIPALANASYDWTVPSGWIINSGTGSNIINVTPGSTEGVIAVHETNGCANLSDTIAVTTVPATVAGRVDTDNTVCTGTNSTLLTLNGETGNILNWISSTDGTDWTAISDTTSNYTVQNLTATTQYRAVVQNGNSCSIDTSAAAIITVDQKNVGGTLTPDITTICAGETINSFITLAGNTGSVLNWQSSNDSVNWSDFLPAKTDSVYNVNQINTTTYYRVIIKTGVCPADTSSVASINFSNSLFPVATIDPEASSICYGKTVQLNATITTGTAYTWSNTNSLSNPGDGIITSLPYNIHATASPLETTDYVLTVTNAGCPNTLIDTFHVAVAPQIVVFAGNDTTIALGQDLQLNATVSDPSANQFNWTPASGLNFSNILDPVASLDAWAGGSITYVIRAANADGCYGEDDIKVTVFKTASDIFVPSAFSPNGDGRNDIISPICVGITQLNFFKIYNRWGQLIFSTNKMGKGWDGLINGTPEPTSSFVYMAQGVDYTGKAIFRKGTITLVR